MEEEERNTSLADDNASSDDATSDSETDLMVTSRARRTTAGNRYDTLLAQEELKEDDEEDEVAMLFAEGEGEDEDFNSDEGDEEADMSSSDDDDQGPNVGAEDLEGEKVIEKEAKAERAKKRKADLALTTVASLRKRPRIDPTALRRAPVPKPSKRKERVSWLPETGVLPGRISLRKQTILHRAETHAKLKENEEQRLKLKARREKREREREAEAPKEMTQADRLAEAERVERRNAKSLNKWEAMEKKRAEEQAARLAALKERKLDGAVVTWHSSKWKYSGLKDSIDNEFVPPVEHKKRGRKSKALLEQLAAAKLAESEMAATTTTQGQIGGTIQPLGAPSSQLSETGTEVAPVANLMTPNTIADNSRSETKEPEEAQDMPLGVADATSTEDASSAFLTGIHEYATMKGDSKAKDESVQSGSPTPDVSEQQKDTTTLQQVVPEVPAKSSGEDNEPERNTLKPISKSPVPSSVDPMVMDLSPSKRTELQRQDPQPKSSLDTSDSLDAPMSGTNDRPSQPGEAAAEKAVPEEVASETAASETAASETAASVTAASVKAVSEKVSPEKASPEKSANQKDAANNAASEKAALKDQSVPPSTDGTVNVDTVETKMDEPMQSRSSMTPADSEQRSATAASAESSIEVLSTRNLVILDKFDCLSEQDRYAYNMFYNHRKSAKPVKLSQELCPITGLPAKYRDPNTGIAYANSLAYKKLQDLKKQELVWSTMLGCYVGRAYIKARGVPEGFLGT